MEKNPKKLNPVEPFIRTYPGQQLNNGSVSPTASDMLPAIFQTETNKKVLSAIVDDLFQPSSLETLNFSVGQNATESLLPHPTARRQLEPGLVTYATSGVKTLSADEVAAAWNLNDRLNETPVPVSILDLPIDPDKFINWTNYYWIEQGMPVAFVTGGTTETVNVVNDIIGKQYYTTPVQHNGKTLKLKNGMKIAFQQDSRQADVQGDATLTYVSSGSAIDPLNYELTSYNKTQISITIDSVPKIVTVDYYISGNEIHWLTLPTVGSIVNVVLLNYYVTTDSDLILRRWQVEGVGTEAGIKLLSRTYQNTNTAYSRSTDGLWDQTAVPFDRVEWDGTISGINAKHYILQKPGAENRNAHSRVNVWYHADAIQSVADFLGITFEDVAVSVDKATRPIIEFDSKLELFRHGTSYRPWVAGVEKLAMSPAYYVGMNAREANIAFGAATSLTPINLINLAPRVLWFTKNSEFHGKIINFKGNLGKIVGYSIEEANDGDVVVVNSLVAETPMEEFYWQDGVAMSATYRTSITQQPLFELYSKDGVRLSDFDAVTGYKPSVISSNIIKMVAGDTYDKETGYKLKFLPTQFTQLSSSNTAKNAMYNILYQHTQNEYSYYVDSEGDQRTVSGPYSFRRINGQDLDKELSNGFRRAWFRLKSWACRSYQIESATTVELDASMWPTYEWTIAVRNNIAVVLHSDNFQNVVDNRAVVARGELVKFNIAVPGATSIVVNGTSHAIVDSTVEFLIEDDADDVLTFQIGSFSFKARVINVNADPRYMKFTLNGLPTTVEPLVTVVDGRVTALSIQANQIGQLFLEHQGNVITNDRLTSIPGLKLNPTQTDNFGEFTAGRLVHGMLATIAATQQPTQSWIDCPQVLTGNGIYMADDSALRSTWASLKLSPTLQDTVIARSLSAWRWYRKFIAKLEENINLLDLESQLPRLSLDRMLEELLLGVTYSSTDAVSGMVFPTTSMSSTTYVANGTMLSFTLGNNLSTGLYGPDHVYVYVDGVLLQHNVDYTLDASADSVVFKNVPAVDSIIEIFHASEISAYSAMPASPTKLGMSGLFVPGIKTETWGNNSRTFIQRHDGSRITAYDNPNGSIADYYVNKIILELENRIFNGCVNAVGETNRQRLVCNYSATDVLESQARAQLEWFASNSLNYRDRTDFVNTDPWTWNYNGFSWRGLYIKHFGTFEIHTAPWEALGFDSAPAWWATHYSWTDTTKRSALEYALKNGIISAPGTAITTLPAMIRTVDTFPVSTTGELLDPSAWGLSPSATEAQQPWEIGSFGPVEMAWRRSISGAWAGVLHAIDDYDTVNKFFDSAMNPFSTSSFNAINCVTAKGVNSIAPSQFFQERPSIGIGAVLFEAYREFNLDGEAPLRELMSIDVRLQFAVGGFTDGAISLQMPFTKYQSGSYVPTEDTFLTMSDGVSIQALRYSAVRIEQDDVGFRVYGFDPSVRSFTVFNPSARSLSTSFPSNRRAIQTPYGTFVEYLEWDTSEVNIPYGSYIANKQDLITFLMGLGEYQMSKGLVLDSLNEQATVIDWKQAALDALAWTAQGWSNLNYCTVGIATTAGIKFKHEHGMLDRLDADLGRTGKIIFNSGRSALASELLISRDIETHTDKVVSLSDDQIVFVDFRIRAFDHIVYVNRKTKFGDLIFDTLTGNVLRALKLFGRRTFNWTGRPSAPGVIVQNSGLLPGFDTLTTDIIESHKPELSSFDAFKTTLARANVVPTGTSVIFDIIQDPTTSHLYRQGLQSASGTTLAINALMRNDNIDMPGRLQDVAVNEQWMFNTGNFGRLDSCRVWEIELRKADITNARQIIRFIDNPAIDQFDLRGDNIVDLIGSSDSRWIARPTQVEFETLDPADLNPEYSQANNWLPSAGIANIADVSLRILTIDELDLNALKLITTVNASAVYELTTKTLFETRSYSRYSDYEVGDYTWYTGTLYRATAKSVGSSTSAFTGNTNWAVVAVTGAILPSIWISDFSSQGWNVLQAMAPMYVDEACPNALVPGLNESKISFASPHGLTEGETFIMSGSGDGSYDKIHKVKGVVDDYNILIEARSSSDEVVYDLVAFKLVSVKFNTEAEWAASGISFIAGMKAYIDYGDTEGTWKIITYVPDADGDNNPDIVERYNGPLVNTANIYRATVVDYDNEDVVASIEVFDPYKGLTIDEVGQYLDYKQVVDPAVYNISELGEVDEYAAMPWNSNNIGQLWWDLSQVRYFEYEQSSDIQYRASHWGEKFADSKVAVYEWVSSETIPSVEEMPTAKRDNSSGVDQIRYSEQAYIDPVTNNRSTRYYYWNTSNVLPANSARPYSAASIESVLNDPDANGVAWLSPISENALLISNFKNFFGNNDKIILRIEQSERPEQVHSTNVLVTEGFAGDVINDYLFHRLESSVVGRDNYRETYPIRYYISGQTYSKGEYVADFANGIISKSVDYGVTDYPILQNLDDNRLDVKSSWQSKYGQDHKIYFVARDFVASTFQNDITRKVLVNGAVSALIRNLFESASRVYYAGYHAVINMRRRVPSQKLHPLRRYGNLYVPHPQSWFKDIVEARRTLTVALNSFLLNIDIVSKPNWSRYLTTYQPLSGAYTRDLTKYWEYADYADADYNASDITTKINSSSEISSLDDTVDNFAIIDSYGDIVEAYTKDGNNITLVYRKNGTIQFRNAVWNGSLGDAWDNARWDSNPWDEDASEIIGNILRAVRYDIFINDDLGYFNLLFFAMVKESLSQLKTTDWVSKTTYLDVAQSSNNSLQPVATFYNKREANIIQYINEVKPFHSKIVDTNQYSKSTVELGVSINESITLVVKTAIVLSTEDEEMLTTESGPYLTAEYDVTTANLTEI